MDSTIDKDALLSEGEEDVTEEELNTPIVLTDRDLGLMTLCHEERYLAYSHIKEGFWPDRSNESNGARRRIRRLTEEGYLKKEWIDHRSQLLYLLGERGRQVLKERNLDQGLDLYRYSEDRDTRLIDHHLMVTNIRLLFRDLGIPGWTSERILMEREHRHFYPDGILNLRGDKIAIEYENGLKSKQRYVDRFASYAKSAEYTLAIFIVAGVVRDWLFELEYRLDQICFVEYKHLFRRKAEAELENKASKFVLAEIL